MGAVLVGGPGVGAAVDAFNLNATYFEKYHVPVLGAIFNKLELTGFYSLESCRREIMAYFEQDESQRGRRPFGFVPLFPSITGENGIDRVDEFIREFQRHVNVQAIVDAAQRIKESPLEIPTKSISKSNGTSASPLRKRPKLEAAVAVVSVPTRTRQEIEQAAINAGAAPSA